MSPSRAFAYLNLGYTDYKELGPGEIVVVITPEGCTHPGQSRKGNEDLYLPLDLLWLSFLLL